MLILFCLNHVIFNYIRLKDAAKLQYQSCFMNLFTYKVQSHVSVRILNLNKQTCLAVYNTLSIIPFLLQYK
jgi:hypothetical protein